MALGESLMCIANVSGLVVNQESLWRHGVVHDPERKKLKVVFTCNVPSLCLILMLLEVSL